MRALDTISAICRGDLDLNWEDMPDGVVINRSTDSSC